MKNATVFLGFAPWIIFSVVSSPSTWQYAALASFVSALILSVPTLRRRHAIGILDAAGLVFFGVLTLLTLVLDRSTLQPMENQAMLISNVAIAVVGVGSVIVGHPFTEFYAKESVPQEYWGSPRFHHVNVVISAVWGVTFVLGALCSLAVTFLDANSGLVQLGDPYRPARGSGEVHRVVPRPRRLRGHRRGGAAGELTPDRAIAGMSRSGWCSLEEAGPFKPPGPHIAATSGHSPRGG